MSDVQRLYSDIVSKQTDIETVVLQDHSKVEDMAPNISFEVSEDCIYARVPLKNEDDFVKFIKEQEQKGYVVLAD